MTKWLFIFWLSVGTLQAQNWSLSLATGGEVGRWTYFRGIDSVGNSNGFDRNILSPVFPLELGLHVQKQHLSLALHLQARLFLDDKMLPAQYKRRPDIRYKTSEGYIGIFSVGLDAAYRPVFQRPFTFDFIGGLGLSSIQTTHPERAFFGQPWYWRLGLRLNRHFDHWTYFVKFHFGGHQFGASQAQARQQIFVTGLQIGAKFHLYTPK